MPLPLLKMCVGDAQSDFFTPRLSISSWKEPRPFTVASEEPVYWTCPREVFFFGERLVRMKLLLGSLRLLLVRPKLSAAPSADHAITSRLQCELDMFASSLEWGPFIAAAIERRRCLCVPPVLPVRGKEEEEDEGEESGRERSGKQGAKYGRGGN
jgi:hypothetical protein